MWRRKLLMALIVGGLLLVGGYMGVGYYLYNSLADIDGRCDVHTANRPDQFIDRKDHWEDYPLDTEPYFMSTYEAVSFPSRDPEITVSGWYVPGDPNAPAVIVIHGLGSCKYAAVVLAPAGMLARHDFNVLVIDLRDAGDSTWEDGRSAIGNEEYLDVLGAVDWLIDEKGVPAGRIGLFGNSMGAATALIAFAEEPAVGAVFVDSPFDNLPQIIREELSREGYPQFLYFGGIWMGRLVNGDSLVKFDPYVAIEKANGRPLYFVHGTDDTRIAVHHTYQLREKAHASGVQAEFWIVEGVDHILALAAYPDEYEQRLVDFIDRALTKEGENADLSLGTPIFAGSE